MRGRTLLLALAVLAAACSTFRAQHSAEMWHPSAAVAIPAPDATGASFARVQAEIFTPHCAVPECHVTADPAADTAPPQGLVLEAGSAYDMIVGVPSHETELPRVAPGDPEGSYLFRKVSPDLPIGWHRMPLEGAPLSDDERTLLRSWIAAGAPRE